MVPRKVRNNWVQGEDGLIYDSEVLYKFIGAMFSCSGESYPKLSLFHV